MSYNERTPLSLAPSMTEEVIYRPAKHPQFISLQNCRWWCLTITSFGLIPALCCCYPCVEDELEEASDTFLTEDAVYVNTGINDCCCHVARDRQIIPLEHVIDVQISYTWTGICCCYDIKAVQIIHPGSPMPSPYRGICGCGDPLQEFGVMEFLADPEEYREKVMEAHFKKKVRLGIVDLKGCEDIDSLRPIQRIERLNQLKIAGMITDTEYEAKVAEIKRSDEFIQQKNEILR